jgi:hypothetical protein
LLDRVLGRLAETIANHNTMYTTRSINNIGKLPAYNINLRWATRTSKEYPTDYFENAMQDDSLHFQIVFPGIAWLDTQRVSLDSNIDSLSIQEIAYEMYSKSMVMNVHYWLEYQDISGKIWLCMIRSVNSLKSV